jgi:hypothetical protein
MVALGDARRPNRPARHPPGLCPLAPAHPVPPHPPRPHLGPPALRCAASAASSHPSRAVSPGLLLDVAAAGGRAVGGRRGGWVAGRIPGLEAGNLGSWAFVGYLTVGAGRFVAVGRYVRRSGMLSPVFTFRILATLGCARWLVTALFAHVGALRSPGEGAPRHG